MAHSADGDGAPPLLGARGMLAVALSLRAAGALLAPIMDCDETFNFLEPVHYVAHGAGMQTWEYSPAFALRSYALVELYAAPVRAALLLGLDKVQTFYFLRSVVGLVSAASEAAFCDAVSRRLGADVGLLTFGFLALSSGMFHSAVAVLPSTACMQAVLLGFAAWLRLRPRLALWCGSFAVLLGMPVAAPLFVPMGVRALAPRVLGLCGVVGVAVQSLVAFAAVPSCIDWWYYGGARPIWATGNHLLYNALGVGGGGAGADLYGTEPWSFYAKNLLLNFNIVALLAPLAGVLVAVAPAALWAAPCGRPVSRAELLLVILLPMYVTLGIFFRMSHKEERFLTMTYPLLCLSAALSVRLGLGLLARIAASVAGACCQRRGPSASGAPASPVLSRAAAVLLVAAAGGLSASRSAALSLHFGAPLRLYERLYYDAPSAAQRPGGVCIGKEWYRFPSSFFLPSLPLLWLRSSFDGQLPRPYGPWPRGLSDVPPDMNDRNAHEESRYSKEGDCGFLVELELPHLDEPPVDRTVWEPLHCERFLDADRSPLPWRALYVPGGISDRKNVFGEYCLWRRRAPTGAAESAG